MATISLPNIVDGTDADAASVNSIFTALEQFIDGTTASADLTITGILTALQFQISGTDVLTATTLGTGVLTSSLTTVGALDAGSITSGFGSIDVGASSIDTSGTITGGSVVGTTVTGTLQTAAQPNITSLGTIAALVAGTVTASGAIVGATITGTQQTAAQPNITSLGTIAALVAGTVTASGIVSVDDTTESTSATTGSIHTDGGLGVAKDIYGGGNLTLTTNASAASAPVVCSNATGGFGSAVLKVVNTGRFVGTTGAFLVPATRGGGLFLVTQRIDATDVRTEQYLVTIDDDETTVNQTAIGSEGGTLTATFVVASGELKVSVSSASNATSCTGFWSDV